MFILFAIHLTSSMFVFFLKLNLETYQLSFFLSCPLSISFFWDFQHAYADVFNIILPLSSCSHSREYGLTWFHIH